MKASQIILGLVVWLASVGAAYYVGAKINAKKQEVAEVAAPKIELRKTSEIDKTTQSTASTRNEPTVNSLMAMSLNDLGEALRQSDDLSEEDRRALLTEAFALPGNDYRRSRMIRNLLQQIAETSPVEALSLADEIGSLRETKRARVSILEVWGENDPVAALAWAESALANQPAGSRNEQILAIYRGYAEQNPKAAFAAALSLPASNSAEQRLQMDALEEVITEQIQNGGLLDAKLQVELLEDGPVKDSVFSDFIDRWASYDPEGAAAYIDTLGDEVSTSVKSRLLGEWAENDPAAAAAWLDSQEFDERTLGYASRAIIREWTDYDMTASAEWLNSQPSTPALDRAVMSYAYSAAQEDPASAMTWAESIDNDWMRTRMMQHVAGNWKNDDPDAFQSYIDNSGLDDKQKKALQEAEARHGGSRWWR